MGQIKNIKLHIVTDIKSQSILDISAMEKTYYYMKGRTCWTYAEWFQDPEYWDASLKGEGAMPSSSLTKEEDNLLTDLQQGQVEDEQENSENKVDIHETWFSGSVQHDNSVNFLESFTSDGQAPEETDYGRSSNHQPSCSHDDKRRPSPSTLEKEHVCSLSGETFS